MSYETFIANPNSKKNLLIEIDLRTSHIKWLTLEPNIFQWDLTDFGKGTEFNFRNGSFGYGAFGSSGIADTGGIADSGDPNIRIEDSPVKIGSITVDTIDYTEVGTRAALRATDAAYMFNKETQLLFIHFKDGKWPEEFREDAISIGVTSGYASQIPDVYDGIEYKPKIVGIPALSESQDPLIYGILAFKLNSFTLDNVDGELDSFGKYPNNPFGSNVRMLFGGEGLPYGAYQIVMVAKIEDFDFTETEMIVNLIDSRKAINISLPENVFKIADYPYLNEDNINKKIPLRYGVLRRVEVICTNEDETGPPESYSFKICDTSFHGISAIIKVYVKDEEATHRATGADSLADATFEIKPGYQECGLSGKSLTTETGLSTATKYYFKVATADEGEKEYNITTEADTTYAAVMALMNKRIKKGVFHLVAGDLRCTSKTSPGLSTIVLSAGQALDLFAALTGFSAFDTAVEGEGYKPGDKVTIDMIGYVFGINDYGKAVDAVIDHPLDITRDLIINHSINAIWSDDFFETIEWQIATNQIVAKTAISIEDDSMIDIIEDFCNTVQGLFIIRPDNIYTFKNYNITAKSRKSIAKEEFEEPLHVSYEGDHYISSAKIKFDRNWEKNTYRREIDDDSEDEQETKYNRVNRRDFETLLSDRDHAANLGRAIVIRNKDIIPIFTVVTKSQNIDLKLFDTVNLEADRIDKVWYGNVKCEVISKDVDFSNFMITFQLRYIRDVIEVTLSDTAEFGIYYGDGYYLDGFYMESA